MLRLLSLIVEVDEKSEGNEILSEFRKELRLLLERFWRDEQVREINLHDSYEDENIRIARPPRIYWFKAKDVLLFDAGLANGSIHVYEFKRRLDAEELKELLKKYGQGRSWRLLKDMEGDMEYYI